MRYALAFAVLALAGCESFPKQVTIPENLLAPCEAPVVDPRSNAGLSDGLVAYHEALKNCNDDKAAIREHLKEN